MGFGITREGVARCGREGMWAYGRGASGFHSGMKERKIGH